jgi:hypothetical protein
VKLLEKLCLYVIRSESNVSAENMVSHHSLLVLSGGGGGDDDDKAIIVKSNLADTTDKL